jgi:hypothetical protein
MSARMVGMGRSALRGRGPRIALLSLAALAFCAPQAAMASTAPAGIGDTGPIVSGYRSYVCVDDLGNGTANNTPIVTWACNGSPEQNWTIESDGTIQINGKCMDVRRFSRANKTPVRLYTCTGGANQQWVFTMSGTLVNPDSGKCLDDPRFGFANGTQLETFTCNGGRNQQWELP